MRSDKESNSGDRRGRCAMILIVDEEIMKSENGQELVVPPTGEDHETYEEIHISSELTKELTKEQAREITTVLSKYLQAYFNMFM
jgi:hypothetical protein